jgi:hypothetical protein
MCVLCLTVVYKMLLLDQDIWRLKIQVRILQIYSPIYLKSIVNVKIP